MKTNQNRAILAQMGFSPRHTGTHMIEWAAGYLAAQSPAVTMTRHVYPAAGRAFGTSAASAERCMRYANERAGTGRPVGMIIKELARKGDHYED